MKDHEAVHHHKEHVHIDIESSVFTKKTIQPKKVKQQKQKLESVSANIREKEEISDAKSAEIEEATMTYVAYLRSALNLKKSYPIKAKRLGDEGTVVVKLELDETGKLKNLSLLKSSDSKTLDKAAFSLVKRGAPFKKPPEFLEDLVFDVSLEWHL